MMSVRTALVLVKKLPKIKPWTMKKPMITTLRAKRRVILLFVILINTSTFTSTRKTPQ